jgi:alpha-tubulin suppressor-like RCC1 family protein
LEPRQPGAAKATRWDRLGAEGASQLGDGTNSEPRFTPTQEATGSTDWSKISAGHDHTLALKKDGSLWSWGRNHRGQIGNGTVETRTVPTRIGSANWISIAAGHHFSIAIKEDGTLWSWGLNTDAQLGYGSFSPSYKSYPTQIGSDDDWSDISSGEMHTVALKKIGNPVDMGEQRSRTVGDRYHGT